MIEKVTEDHEHQLKMGNGRGMIDSKQRQSFVGVGVGAQVKWATDIRKTHNFEAQANIFYEQYRIILVKEDSLKSRIDDLKRENEQLKSQNQSLDSDYTKLEKRC